LYIVDGVVERSYTAIEQDLLNGSSWEILSRCGSLFEREIFNRDIYNV
jgi:hypothetical protein